MTNLQVRSIGSDQAQEFYITAAPDPNLPLSERAKRLFTVVADVLRAHDARLLEERLFATEPALEILEPLRAAAYGALDDGVPPVRLAVPESLDGPFAGVLVHAVRCDGPIETLRLDETSGGRILSGERGAYVAFTGIVAPERGSAATAQARAVFEKAEAALARAGLTLHAVARTWLWLGDILVWYGEFNQVRNRFFSERGLLDGRPDANRLPASTGIGVRPAGPARCALDLIAVSGRGEGVELRNAIGDQHCAYEYGSAFSRASCAATPAGQTVFISGTAAIDAHGRTEHVGNPRAQIDDTIAHVRAALRDMRCTDADVVQSIAYCATPQVLELFRAAQADLPWPCLTMLADICRPDLLFEIEATAAPAAGV